MNNNFFSGINLDIEYTSRKIHVMREIGPYLPEDYIDPLNKSISFAEKFIKIKELIDLLNQDKETHVLEHIPINNNQDRINKILHIIKKEYPKSEMTKVGSIMNLLLNLDGYQKIFTTLNIIMKNPDALDNPTNLIDLLGPLLPQNLDKDGEKFKEISNMMKILQSMDFPKKEKDDEIRAQGR